MEIETYLYPYSANEARKRGELALWRASHPVSYTHLTLPTNREV